MITIAIPARTPSAGFVTRPFVTASPSPPPPIRPAMTTIESANRIVWLTESRSIRRASGSCTLPRSWPPVEPIALAASTVLVGTPRIPSAVIRTAGGTA